MKHFRLFVLLAFFAANLFFCRATPIHEAQALEKAQAFYYQKKPLLRAAAHFQRIALPPDFSDLLRSGDGTCCLYIYNIGDNEGFIVVSGDDATKDVLGYADQGRFVAENMPANLKSWLKFYQSEILYATHHETSPVPSKANSLSNAVAERSAAAVAPLLGNIAWDQFAPYNLLCPLHATTKVQTVTGCVATAMAQIMKYYEWPVTGTGSNTYSTTYCGTQSVNFSKTNYDWGNMLDQYKSASTKVQDTAVATLMYHCGVAVNMEYNTAANGGSSASLSNAGIAMMDHFSYDPDMQIHPRFFNTDASWKELIAKELDAARPVLYSGSDGSGGHAFVCDGYDDEGLFHINWGWSGYCNGYFELSSLEPYYPGNQEVTGGYSQNQYVVAGIQLPNGTTGKPFQIGMYSKGLTPSSTTSKTFDVSLGFTNAGLNTFNGKFGIGLYKNGVFQKTLAAYPMNINLDPFYGITDYTFHVSLTGLSSGDYEICSIYLPVDSSSWSVMKPTIALNNHLDVTISGSTVTTNIPKNKPELILTDTIQLTNGAYYNKTASFNVTVQNKGTEFYSNLGVKIYSTTNELVNQYIDFGVVCVPAGEIRTFTLSGTISCAPGSYYAVAVFDSTNTGSTTSFKQIGPVEYSQLPVTVLNEPSDAVLSLIGDVVLSDGSTLHRNEAFTLSADIKNTGGYFNSQIAVFVYPDWGGSAITNLPPKTVSIDSGETKTVSFTSSLGLDPGEYIFVLFYQQYSWIQLSNYIYFTLEEASDLQESTVSDMQIHPNPVVDRLYLETSEPITRMCVTDLSGKTVRETENAASLSVSDMSPGIYFLRIETKSGVKTRRFLKK